MDHTVADNRSLRADASGDQPLYGALDLGTNNCRLLLATPAGAGLHVVEAFSKVTRLGEGLAASGTLSTEAIERSLSALRQCALRLQRRNVLRARAVATEACRQAANGALFLERVRREIGLDLETISAEDEAKLALAGCAPLLDRQFPFALVFDIGGGSTELVKVKLGSSSETDRVETLASLPLGVVTLAEAEGAKLDTPAGYARTVEQIVERLRPFDRDSGLGALTAAGQVHMLGTSGTVTTLAGVHLNLPRYDRAVVDGLVMEFSAIEKISRQLATATATERAAFPCIGDTRADLVVAGCAILEAIRRLWPVGRLTVADRGVREGILLSMMRADQMVGKA
ncbi:Ppx/GppA phosphatase family protein [Telmatospirillum sp.]|uniref:Ppx/GppA phosphatase family protein n=1 Tax=Telmatospirillum sp. TaxID=2079197 RepID=UPI00283DFE97|nr:Ppx/GppA phosphatase family protein [Telmatospirillum sp.]MDR3438404.1 Ppx/GppA phosphatase family protein [Telmatospirillum sp.]